MESLSLAFLSSTRTSGASSAIAVNSSPPKYHTITKLFLHILIGSGDDLGEDSSPQLLLFAHRAVWGRWCYTWISHLGL